jgi:hypothetical protein
MADYFAIRVFFDKHQYHYFTFHPKSEKPIKAVIRQLPANTPAEDIASSLQDLGCSHAKEESLCRRSQRPLP